MTSCVENNLQQLTNVHYALLSIHSLYANHYMSLEEVSKIKRIFIQKASRIFRHNWSISRGYSLQMVFKKQNAKTSKHKINYLEKTNGKVKPQSFYVVKKN